MANRFHPAVPVPRLGDKLDVLYRHSAGVDGHAALGRLFRKDIADPRSGISGKAISKWIEGEGGRPPDHVPADRWDRFVEIFQSRLPGKRSTSEVQAMLSAPGSENLLTAFVDRPPTIDWTMKALSAPPATVALVRAPAPGSLAISARNRPNFATEEAIPFPVGQDFRFRLGDVAPGWLLALQWDARRGWFGVDLADEGEDLAEAIAGNFLPAESPFLIEHDPVDCAFFFIHSPVPLPPSLAAHVALSARSQAPLDAALLQRLAQQLDVPGTSLTRLAVAFRT